MTTIEDKISLFSKIIYEKLNEEKEEKLKVFNEEAELKMSAERKKIAQIKKVSEREIIRKANVKASGIIAKENLNKQREMLRLKDDIIKTTIKEIKDKLLTFVNSKEYEDYLMSTVTKNLKLLNKGEYYLIVLDRDLNKYQSQIKAISEGFMDKRVEIKVSKDDFIGGIMIKDFDGRFNIDNSIYSKLEESKELIGIKVMEMLD
ncbi:H+transporting two-sector ATPase E subunit [Clostridium putrefaciens]|uniref:H+transporting two-sector ATPase E subunit n=1 Tax=Clostridium putrefaciens TaxID=99675 RepID=A0A381J7V4_9CLOT|nr:V-type ATP synthase subunit E family protein [Clostridium putrefaciens]SUY47079.1 H+transporting two-sector ATPase E subunit [Clostridium putrefaciens]